MTLQKSPKWNEDSNYLSWESLVGRTIIAVDETSENVIKLTLDNANGIEETITLCVEGVPTSSGIEPVLYQETKSTEGRGHESRVDRDAYYRGQAISIYGVEAVLKREKEYEQAKKTS